MHYTDNGRKSFVFFIDKNAKEITAEDTERYSKSVVAVLMCEDGMVESITGRDNKEIAGLTLKELCVNTEIFMK